MSNNELTIIVEENNLSQDFASTLQASFTPFFDQAKVLSNEAKAIVVTAPDQTQLMATARAKRLKLKAIRVDVENKRKELKEESMRTGRAIDGMANVIKFLIVPIEEHLQLQEDFLKIAEEKRKAELAETRRAELASFGLTDPEYDLENMSEGGYSQLLENTKLGYQAKKDAEAKAEQEAIERDRKYKLHNARKDQLIPYWIYLKGDQVSIDFGELPQESFDILLREVKAAQKAKTIADEKLRAENKKKEEANKKLQDNLKKEREKREKVEKQIRDQKENERKALEEKQKADKETELANLKAEKEARLAPDKEKMRVIYTQMHNLETQIADTSFANAEVKELATNIVKDLQSQQERLIERMKTL